MDASSSTPVGGRRLRPFATSDRVRPGERRRLGTLPAVLVAFLCTAGHGLTPLSAQITADLPREVGDTIPEWDHLFPIWGDRAVERGFDIPYPVGIGADIFAQRFDVTITDPGLSVGDAPTVPIDVVTFDSAETTLIIGLPW